MHRLRVGVAEGSEEVPVADCFPLEYNLDYLNGGWSHLSSLMFASEVILILMLFVAICCLLIIVVCCSFICLHVVCLYLLL